MEYFGHCANTVCDSASVNAIAAAFAIDFKAVLLNEWVFIVDVRTPPRHAYSRSILGFKTCGVRLQPDFKVRLQADTTSATETLMAFQPRNTRRLSRRQM